MKTGMILIIAILIVNVTLVVAQPPPQNEPYIVIDDNDDKVKFNKLSVGDLWHVTLTDPSTGKL